MGSPAVLQEGCVLVASIFNRRLTDPINSAQARGDRQWKARRLRHWQPSNHQPKNPRSKAGVLLVERT